MGWNKIMETFESQCINTFCKQSNVIVSNLVFAVRTYIWALRNLSKPRPLSGSNCALAAFIHPNAARYSVRSRSIAWTVPCVSFMARLVNVSTSWCNRTIGARSFMCCWPLNEIDFPAQHITRLLVVLCLPDSFRKTPAAFSSWAKINIFSW